MKRFDAVLLDLYDTLAWAPRERYFGHATQEALGIDAELFREAMARTRPDRGVGAYATQEAELAAVLEVVGVEVDEGSLRRLAAVDEREWVEAVRLFDDVPACLQRLRADGLRTALVSNCSRQTDAVVKGLRLDRSLDATVLSFAERSRKPQEGIYRAALAALQVPADRALFVDDVAEYLHGATALGIETVQIVRPGLQRRPGTHPRIGSLEELVPLLD
ncbi:MAG: HAD-IA family hydrolase [Actinomycetota bacterium]